MSASAIVELSRSKRRYHDQDALLQAFVNHGGFTAKEVAVEVLDWRYEQYANSPKRAFDLQKLGYLEQLTGRECRQTGKVAHTYRATGKGLDHLRGAGRAASAVVYHVRDESPVAANPEDARRYLGDIRSLLGSAHAE